MKTISAVLLSLFFGLKFCDTVEPQYSSFNYKVHVDSIQVASQINLGDTLVVRFFGTIASDGCSSFSHFEALIGTQGIDLTVWAKRQEAAACPSVMVYLDGREFKWVVNSPGPLPITIHQPDGSTFQRTVLVG